jgi:hypothetical protein
MVPPLIRTPRTGLLVLALGSLAVGPARGQYPDRPALHVLIVADASPVGWNADARSEIENDRENLRIMFRKHVPPDTLRLTILPQAEITRAGILAAIDRLQVASADTIVFCWTGHGITGASDDRAYYRIPIAGVNGAPDDADDVPRSLIRDRIRQKRPAHLVIMSDCCATYTEPRTPPVTRDAGLLRDFVPPAPREISRLFKHLFFEYKGVTVISSCSPGQVSMFYWGGEGSLFTRAFRVYADRLMDQRCTWERFAELVRAEVRQTFADKYPNGVARMAGGAKDQMTQVADLRDDEAHGPFLGMRVVQVGPSLVIQEVFLGGRAHVVGVPEQGVLLEVNRQPVNTEREFADKVDNSPAAIQLTVRHEGVTRSYTINRSRGNRGSGR